MRDYRKMTYWEEVAEDVPVLASRRRSSGEEAEASGMVMTGIVRCNTPQAGEMSCKVIRCGPDESWPAAKSTEDCVGDEDGGRCVES
jgi:hypothetical protein